MRLVSSPQSPFIRCGPAGWLFPHWESTVYPRPVPRGFHPLEFLADRFDVIEIPQTFHQIPKPELAKLWGNRVSHNTRFRFTARLHRDFTHERRLDREIVRAFTEGLQPLQEQERLGCVLMQFPSAFRFTAENKEFLIRLRRAFPSLPLVAELQHASWGMEEGVGTLIDSHVGFCNLDQPAHVRAMPPTAHLTWRVGYVKLYGRAEVEEPGSGSGYLCKLPELDQWKKRIDQVARFAESTYVIFHNDGGGASAINALQMQGILESNRTTAKLPPGQPWMQGVEQTKLFSTAAA